MIMFHMCMLIPLLSTHQNYKVIDVPNKQVTVYEAGISVLLVHLQDDHFNDLSIEVIVWIFHTLCQIYSRRSCAFHMPPILAGASFME